MPVCFVDWFAWASLAKSSAKKETYRGKKQNMMRKKLVLCAVGLIVLCYQVHQCKSIACDGFLFSVPTLENSSFSAPENTNLTVKLKVEGKGTCTSFNFKKIIVWLQDVLPGNESETLSIIRKNNSSNQDCTYTMNNGITPLECSITISNIKRDKQLLIESIPNTTVEGKTVPINVAYPTTIIDFRITPSQEVEENETVKVTCTWVNGNPPPRILIRNPKNKDIVSNNPDNQRLDATIFEGNITCSDSGQYRCEAAGIDQYKTADLMVKCPPRIMIDTEEKTVVLGSNAVFLFDVFSYKNPTVCTLEEPRINGPRRCSSDKTEIKISGTPPRLRLEIKVKNAREDDKGTWRLTVDNGFTDNAGVPVHATVSFTLRVYLQSPPISPGMSAMIGVVGFLTIVIVVLVVSVVYFRKKIPGQRKGAINSTHNSDSQGDPDRVSGHSYEEIPDAAAPRPPRCHHHGQGQTSRPGRSPAAPTRPAVDSQPEDYLYPVSSQPASSRTNQPHDAPAATPVGPYDSLEMSDVGLRSAYSQLGM